MVVGLGDLSPDMWQGFEKVRRPPYTQATQAPPPAHPLITRIAPRHKARVPHRVEYRLAHRPRGMPGYRGGPEVLRGLKQNHSNAVLDYLFAPLVSL